MIAPAAKLVSPTIRIQRRLSIKPVCKNSAARAYHVPYSTDPEVCIKPIGKRRISAFNARPMLIARKAAANRTSRIRFLNGAGRLE